MPGSPRDDLIAALKRTPSPLFVVGTEISIGAVGGPEAVPVATWPGLIEDGLRQAQASGHKKKRWLDSQLALLDEALDDGGVDDLLSVASTIEKVLARPGGA